MSSPSSHIGSQTLRRSRAVLLAVVFIAVLASVFGIWRFLARGSAHTTTQTTIATLAAENCSHAIATEPAGASWIPVTSTAPSDIAATMESDWLPNLESRLGPLTQDTPALVYPINMRTGYDANDCPHWIASFHSTGNTSWGDLDYVFDPTHSRVRFMGAGSIYSGDSRFGKPFPYVTRDEALALLRQQRHVAGSTTDTPMLVFFALKQGWSGNSQPGNTATHFWTDSGTVAADPIWRIVGADGKVYFVGEKQHVYTEADVPIA